MLAQEVLDLLKPVSGGVYLDGTVGGGGHAQMILEASAPDGRLIGLDRDPEALAAAAERLDKFSGQVVLRHGNYADLAVHLEDLGVAAVDGILLDVGVSSYQLDQPARGFSFREDGPLDMRMDPAQGLSAADVVATAPAEELKRIFREYGEERWASRIAREIERCRALQPLETTLQLADLVCRVIPGRDKPQRIHPATRVFQALRIHVNQELEGLASGLEQGLASLKPGGRMVVISFHSLEDRMVKQAFRQAATGCVCPPRLAVCMCGQRPLVRLLNRRGIRAGDAEKSVNPRARSAILRGVERLH